MQSRNAWYLKYVKHSSSDLCEGFDPSWGERAAEERRRRLDLLPGRGTAAMDKDLVKMYEMAKEQVRGRCVCALRAHSEP